MIKILKLNLICLISFLLLSSFKPVADVAPDTTIIKAGSSKITGKITTPNKNKNDSVFVIITIPHPITGEYVKYKSLVNQIGKFLIDVDVETDNSLVVLSTSLNPYKFLYLKLTSGCVTNINIEYNENDDIKNIGVIPYMNQYDMIQGFELMGKMIEYDSGRLPEPLYNKNTDYFLSYAKAIVSERLDILKSDKLISKEFKAMLSKDFLLFMYIAHVLPYEEEMTKNYYNTIDDKSKTPDIQKIDKSYFRFLRDFNLNDSQYLNCSKFQEFQKEILRNEILNLPEIRDINITSWISKVKNVLTDLVGFNDGPYYDILAANAFGRQFTEELRPLTEKQKENIGNYWKEGEIAKILFRKNKEVIELSKLKSSTVVNDILLVPDNNLMETILSKYKDKVVFIDLWATWCSPCLDAMQQFRSTKNEFRDKNVVFVYLTNTTSPRKLWEEKIKGIGNEHYYLTESQWTHIMNFFKFDGIPSYLLYDKKGVLVNKFTAFPGNEDVKNMINSKL